MPKQTIRAAVVSVTKRSYDAFTDRGGATVPAGTTHTAWVIEDEERAPVSVKVTADQYEELRRHGFGTVVEFDCWLNAQGNRIVYAADKDTGVTVIDEEPLRSVG